MLTPDRLLPLLLCSITAVAALALAGCEPPADSDSDATVDDGSGGSSSGGGNTGGSSTDDLFPDVGMLPGGGTADPSNPRPWLVLRDGTPQGNLRINANGPDIDAVQYVCGRDAGWMVEAGQVSLQDNATEGVTTADPALGEPDGVAISPGRGGWIALGTGGTPLAAGCSIIVHQNADEEADDYFDTFTCEGPVLDAATCFQQQSSEDTGPQSQIPIEL